MASDDGEQGATGDGTTTIDLGDWCAISEIDTAFYAGDNWPAGGAMEISADKGS